MSAGDNDRGARPELYFPRGAPIGAGDAEIAAIKLPFDIAVGNVVLRKGVPLLSLVALCRTYHRQLYGGDQS
jgi:hypothetical protein